MSGAASDCPAGEYSALGVSTCTACLDGTFAASAQSSSCTTCPAGYECPDKDQAPDICPAGEYRYAASPNIFSESEHTEDAHECQTKNCRKKKSYKYLKFFTEMLWSF